MHSAEDSAMSCDENANESWQQQRINCDWRIDFQFHYQNYWHDHDIYAIDKICSSASKTNQKSSIKYNSISSCQEKARNRQLI